MAENEIVHLKAGESGFICADLSFVEVILEGQGDIAFFALNEDFC